MRNNDTKKQRASSPAGGYCLQRTRRRLARLLWALFYLAVGLGAGALFISELLADKSGWDYMDYIVRRRRVSHRAGEDSLWPG